MKDKDVSRYSDMIEQLENAILDLKAELEIIKSKKGEHEEDGMGGISDDIPTGVDVGIFLKIF